MNESVEITSVTRKREILRRGAARVGLAAAANFGVDPRILGGSCGFALRAAVATFWMVSMILEKVAVWMVVRVYSLAVWTVRALVGVLDWVEATY